MSCERAALEPFLSPPRASLSLLPAPHSLCVLLCPLYVCRSLPSLRTHGPHSPPTSVPRSPASPQRPTSRLPRPRLSLDTMEALNAVTSIGSNASVELGDYIACVHGLEQCKNCELDARESSSPPSPPPPPHLGARALPELRERADGFLCARASSGEDNSFTGALPFASIESERVGENGGTDERASARTDPLTEQPASTPSPCASPSTSSSA